MSDDPDLDAYDAPAVDDAAIDALIDSGDWRRPRGPIEIYPSPTYRTVPLLQKNPVTVNAVADILGLTRTGRIVAVDISFGNGLGDAAGAATATVEILIDADQLRRLVDVATDHDIEYPT